MIPITDEQRRRVCLALKTRLLEIVAVLGEHGGTPVSPADDFSWKTEALAYDLGINLDDLPARIGISRSMFYGYRTGRCPISSKAWRKLAHACKEAGQ